MSALIEPEELLEDLKSQSPSLKLIDASFAMPGSEITAFERYQQKRISNSVFFDIDKIADPASNLPHMLPTPEIFSEHIEKLGISSDDNLVIYGQENFIMGPCRTWWTFKIFGHENVRVLNSNLKEWDNAGHPVNTSPPSSPETGSYKATFNEDAVASMAEIKNATNDENTLIIDARAIDRFTGEVEEPREGLKKGHIPGSINLPCTQLTSMLTGKMKSPEELKEILSAIGINGNKNIISSCGSGVTACVLVLAMHEAEITNKIKVYDGSWSEWGQENLDLIAETC